MYVHEDVPSHGLSVRKGNGRWHHCIMTSEMSKPISIKV